MAVLWYTVHCATFSASDGRQGVDSTVNTLHLPWCQDPCAVLHDVLHTAHSTFHICMHGPSSEGALRSQVTRDLHQLSIHLPRAQGTARSMSTNQERGASTPMQSNGCNSWEDVGQGRPPAEYYLVGGTIVHGECHMLGSNHSASVPAATALAQQCPKTAGSLPHHSASCCRRITGRCWGRESNRESGSDTGT